MGAAIGHDPFQQATGTNLFLSWMGGCSEDLVSLTLYKFGDRYVVDKQTVSNGCALQVGIYRNVVLTLRAPIHPAQVDFAALEASVR